MASVRRRKNSRFWTACITGGDGKQRQFSTGLEDEAEALAVAVGAERACRRSPKIHQLRAALGRLADDFTPAEDMRVAEWLAEWLAGKKGEVERSTHSAYDKAIQDFTAFSEAEGLTVFSSITPAVMRRFRDGVAKRLSAITANHKIKLMGAAFADAVRAKVIEANPCAGLPRLREKKTRRREFRKDELEALLGAVSGEWKGMVLLGLWTGQRLADLATLKWSSLDLTRRTIHFTAGKTDDLVGLPLMAEVVDCLAELPAGDAPAAFVFPGIAAAASSTRSGIFRAILAGIGLALPKGHKSENTGGRRKSGELCFHSLRHTSTTMLKSAGVSDAIAMAIVGHRTKAVSAGYTHIDMDTMRRALEMVSR
jgi:integrase